MNKRKGNFKFRIKFRKHSEKIFSSIISIAVIFLLFFSGPVYAFSLSLGTPSNTSPTKGNTIYFTATMDIENNDVYIPVENFTLFFDGPSDKTCIFNVSGTIVSGCTGINITMISVPATINYSYGYGNDSQGNTFGNGYGYSYVSSVTNQFKYNVSLDTTNYDAGTYTIAFTTKIRTRTYSATNQTLTVNVATTDTSDEGSSGGGGVISGGGSEWKAELIVLDKQLVLGYRNQLPEKWRLKVPVNNETHYVGIKNLTATTALIEVSSTPKTKTLLIGEEWNVDVTNDNYYDLNIKLNGISNSKADVTVKRIHKEIPAALFDINLKILEKLINKGKLDASISLTNLGVPGKVDATLSYKILNSKEVVVYEESEKVPVETQTEFVKTFDVSGLKKGDYALLVDLSYSGQKEPIQAKGQFSIVSRGGITGFVVNAIGENKGLAFSFFVLTIILVVALIVFIAKIRKKTL
jgi:hypothetical protein